MIKTISNFLKNVGYNMAADLSTKLVNALLTLLISRFLGVATMGAFSIALSYFGIGLMLSYWGFGNVLTREVAKDKSSYNKYFSNFAIMRLVFAVVVVIGINILAKNLNYTYQTQQLIRIISFGIFANTLMNLIRFLFIAFEELKYLSAISLSVSIIRLFASYLALKSTGSITTVAFVYTITEYIALIIGAAFAIHFLKEIKLQFDLKFSLSQIVRSLPFFWIAFLTVLDNQAEILLLSFFFSNTSVGYYTAMNTVISGVSLFSEGLRNAVFPIFARYQIEAPEKLGTTLLMLGKYILLFTVPIAIGVYYFAEPIIFLLFNSSYTVTVSLLRISIWLFIGYSLNVVVIRMLMTLEREKKVLVSLFISGVLTIVLNLYFSRLWGIKAFAIIRLVTVYIHLILCSIFLYQAGYKLVKLSILLKIAFAGIIMFLVPQIFGNLNTYVSIIISLLLYLAITYISKVIKFDDILLWSDIFKYIFRKPSHKQNSH